jgi:hypothetical protein
LLSSIKTAVRDSVTLPGTPLLFAPLNQTNGIVDSISLSWYPIENAESYRLQLASDISFDNILIDTLVSTATSAVLSNLPNAQNFYWRVSAINDSGSSSFTQPREFETAQAVLGQPNIISPADSSLKVPMNMHFSWSPVPYAGAYQLQLANTPDLCDVFIDTTIVHDTSVVINGFEHDRNYFWHIRSLPQSESSYAAGTFSEWYTFTTISSPPLVPSLSSPADGANRISTNPVLRWHASDFTEEYHLRISLDYDFNQVIFDSSGITANKLKVYNLLFETTYYWSVKAINEVGESPWSETRKFTTGNIEDDLTQLDGESTSFELFQNYPNPFNTETVIRFGLPVQSRIEILISDIQGQSRKLITDLYLDSGIYEFRFDGLNLSSGIYF